MSKCCQGSWDGLPVCFLFLWAGQEAAVFAMSSPALGILFFQVLPFGDQFFSQAVIL